MQKPQRVDILIIAVGFFLAAGFTAALSTITNLKAQQSYELAGERLSGYAIATSRLGMEVARSRGENVFLKTALLACIDAGNKGWRPSTRLDSLFLRGITDEQSAILRGSSESDR